MRLALKDNAELMAKIEDEVREKFGVKKPEKPAPAEKPPEKEKKR